MAPRLPKVELNWNSGLPALTSENITAAWERQNMRRDSVAHYAGTRATDEMAVLVSRPLGGAWPGPSDVKPEYRSTIVVVTAEDWKLKKWRAGVASDHRVDFGRLKKGSWECEAVALPLGRQEMYAAYLGAVWNFGKNLTLYQTGSLVSVRGDYVTSYERRRVKGIPRAVLLERFPKVLEVNSK